jgi:hypothetical protein
MKINLSTVQAVELLLRDERARWSLEGARALVERMEQLEEDTGEEIELDVVALRCEWSEYETAESAARAYGWQRLGENLPEEDWEILCRDWLNEQTTVLSLASGGVVIQQF